MGLSPEESRALLGELPGARGGGRAGALVVLSVVAAALAAAAGWSFVRADRALAERDLARDEISSLSGRLAGRETEIEALRGSLGAAELEVVARDQRLAESAERIARSSREADALRSGLEAAVAAGDALAAAYLRASAPGLGGRRGSMALELLATDPATGATPLEVIASSLPRDKTAAVALATVESLASDAVLSTAGEANAALVLAGGLVADARKAFPVDGPDAVPSEASLLDDALVAAARLAWAVHARGFTDLEARAGLRGDARRFAQEALLLRRAEGGRVAAECLALLGAIAREEGDLAEAASHLEDARREVAKDGDASELAAVEVDLATAWFELERPAEALALLGERAAALATRRAEATPAERGARLRLEQVRGRMLDASGAREGDPEAYFAARLALGEAAADAGRAELAVGVLPEVLAHLARDESRFAARVAGALALARALDQVGATREALRLLGEARFAADLRVLGDAHPLAQEHAAVAARLRAR